MSATEDNNLPQAFLIVGKMLWVRGTIFPLISLYLLFSFPGFYLQAVWRYSQDLEYCCYSAAFKKMPGYDEEHPDIFRKPGLASTIEPSTGVSSVTSSTVDKRFPNRKNPWYMSNSGHFWMLKIQCLVIDIRCTPYPRRAYEQNYSSIELSKRVKGTVSVHYGVYFF